jgi:hypothetical protein
MFALAAVFAGPASARHKPLMDPPPIGVPAGLSVDQVRKAILAGGDKRGWILVDSKLGRLTLRQSPRDLVVDVSVTFDASTVTISYLDSTHMDYSEAGGVKQIHPKYNEWAANLSKDIEASLLVEKAKSE